MGAAIGAGAMYFLDPVTGEARRRQARSFWRENKDDILEVARTTSEQASDAAGKAADTVSKVSSSLGEKIGGASSEPNGPSQPTASQPRSVVKG